MSQFDLLAERKFWPLFWTQFCGAFNDNFLKNAMVILITFSGSQVFGVPASQMVSIAAGIFILPYFIFSATAGQLADKYEKGKIIRIIKMVEVGIMAVAVFGFVFHQLEFLLVVLFGLGLHSTFFGPLKYSILPQHMQEREIVGANALIEAGTFLSILFGTIGGGIFIAIPTYGPTLVSVAILLVAVLGLIASWFIPEAKAVDPTLTVNWNPVQPTWEILKFTAENRTVFLSALGISWFWFFGASFLSLFPTYCKDVLGGNENLVTLFLACFSIGVAVGSMLCEKLSRRSLELGLVPMGSLGLTVFTIDLSFSGQKDNFIFSTSPVTPWDFLSSWAGIHVVVDLLLVAIFSGFFIVPLYALIQERSEVSHRSRVIAGNNILNAIFMVTSSVMLVFLLKSQFSVVQIFMILAALNAVVATYIYTLLPEFFLRFVAWMVANVIYRLRVEGENSIPDSGPALLVCNHVSFVDWLVIGAGIHRPVRFVMHHSFAKGFLGELMQARAKVIPIASAKEDPAILAAAFAKIAKELEAGELVCIFPEGRLTDDGELSIFRPGIEKIIHQKPVPVIPMSLHGMWGSVFSKEATSLWRKLPKRLWPSVRLKIENPIAPKLVTAEAVQAVVQRSLGGR